MKVAVLGTGSIGMQYAHHLLSLGINPILISIREDRKQELVETGWQVASNLAASNADFCIIGTETKRHVNDTIESVGLGMKVLVEKPLGVDVQDVVRLESELNDDDLKSVRVVCPLRWYSGVMQIEHNMKRLGNIHNVSIWCQSYLPDWRERDYKTSYSADKEQGGVLRDLVHEIDYCNALFGLPTHEDLQCIGTDGKLIGVDSSANVHLSWVGREGELVTMQLDYLTRNARRGISVYGENGECHSDLISGEYIEKIDGAVKKEMTKNFKNTAIVDMLRSFLNQDGAGCDYIAAKQAIKVIEMCEKKLHLN